MPQPASSYELAKLLVRLHEEEHFLNETKHRAKMLLEFKPVWLLLDAKLTDDLAQAKNSDEILVAQRMILTVEKVRSALYKLTKPIK
ncbi:hypothetical protein [Candidatus Poriferisocius sp.]|uniref:hypothetical protein n=1 Tax=Candidatus Poriferisocius sp. TaxID=3101276 RepID=UPI003B5303B3